MNTRARKRTHARTRHAQFKNGENTSSHFFKSDHGMVDWRQGHAVTSAKTKSIPECNNIRHSQTSSCCGCEQSVLRMLAAFFQHTQTHINEHTCTQTNTRAHSEQQDRQSVSQSVRQCCVRFLVCARLRASVRACLLCAKKTRKWRIAGAAFGVSFRELLSKVAPEQIVHLQMKKLLPLASDGKYETQDTRGRTKTQPHRRTHAHNAKPHTRTHTRMHAEKHASHKDAQIGQHVPLRLSLKGGDASPTDAKRRQSV